MAIDDEPLALRQVKSYIDRIPQMELAAACRNAVEAQAMLRDMTVDLLLVDINMPDLNGMDFVRQLHNPPLVIFTTAYSEYAIEGFRLDAVDYLLKPFSFADFNRAVGKARSLLELMRLRDDKAPAAAGRGFDHNDPVPPKEHGIIASRGAFHARTPLLYSQPVARIGLRPRPRIPRQRRICPPWRELPRHLPRIYRTHAPCRATIIGTPAAADQRANRSP